ncbi:hypothetical protein ES319_A03G131500v1 [Gossypium barbadense]|uniref:ABC-2 type transporter transmembrane domain-containing protein n=2 Tax=Gossypium TaxID=3633 RepID=A0A5J5WCW4_GOSBA|nr:hypothetical protein ES319_A03G131500v1 [Gossypium barbadense]KAB2090561.1 hypothetical protein ES319_A03G131500v1 [Gossypium barbadense]TYH25161.1 hypothetical protein ES288_A03G147100v1 [Gossypium darwinii]TYH25162.1 hypothetical protein ES288_A03G147100v1 [Gossypium darwinii]
MQLGLQVNKLSVIFIDEIDALATRHDEQDFFYIIGSMNVFMIFTGISSCSSVLPFVSTQRIVIYRERFSRMYFSWAYSLAQVIIEIPYIFLEAVLFLTITYPATSGDFQGNNRPPV